MARKVSGGVNDQLVGGQGTLTSGGARQNDWELLAVCDDGVRLRAPRDAVSDAALADRS